MTWTTPITWVNGSVYADTDLNAQVRDNLLLLKTSIGDDGRFLGLSSSYLANLSGTNLTAVGFLAAANAWTARVDVRTGRLVVPVEGAFTGTDQGDIAVVGTYFYYRNNASANFKYQGSVVANRVGSIPGSVWINGNDLHYIDASNDERLVLGSTSSMHSDAAALGGSMFMVDYVHWIIETGTQEYYSHGDVHSDVGHGDVAHVDAHTDTHTDSHSDTHTDTSVAHNDFHSDAHGDVSGGGHGDAHGDSHTDVAGTHSDSHSDTHGDVGHGDSHTDTHTDTGHSDSHTDQPTAG